MPVFKHTGYYFITKYLRLIVIKNKRENTQYTKARLFNEERVTQRKTVFVEGRKKSTHRLSK